MTGWQIFGTVLAVAVVVGILATMFVVVARDFGLKEAIAAHGVMYGVTGLLVFSLLLGVGVIAP